MKKNYVAPIVEKINIQSIGNTILTVSNVGMGNPFGDGEEGVADAKNSFDFEDDYED